jgi:hypothetical protein
VFNAGFLFILFFDPDDGGDMFFQKVALLSPAYAALYPRGGNSSLKYVLILSFHPCLGLIYME